MSENEAQRLNPQVADVDVGIRSLRTITVYPLSMAGQLKMMDIVTKAIAEQIPVLQENDIAMVTFITNMIKDNLGRIISMVTDEDGDKLLEEMTNMQTARIVEMVYETNYGDVAKNFKSLFGKMWMLFPLERPLPQFVNDTDTDLTTSTESPGEKEE
jgi:uncharacterized glyoxalase superfamily protein PhnB